MDSRLLKNLLTFESCFCGVMLFGCRYFVGFNILNHIVVLICFLIVYTYRCMC